MINRILGFLSSAPPPRPLPEVDAAHLIGAMMLRLARADNRMNLPELQAIDRLFIRRLGMKAVEAAKMRADCERLEEVLPPTEELGALLAAKIPPEQRFALREGLIEVAEADGRIDARESEMIEKIRDLLQRAPDEIAAHNLA
ncbi:TerB family tellurite resistance protein [Falsigemmobacter intermedius]|uniref:tellurite resistance TerB family protein n=1 Tax=Falsigemmobacter intermedius TaxID=1553448 RepID=UPI003F0BD2E4